MNDLQVSDSQQQNENLALKIEWGATSCKITAMENMPTTQFHGISREKLKEHQQNAITYAKLYFEREARALEDAKRCGELFQAVYGVYSPPPSVPNSFLRAYCEALLRGTKQEGKYKKFNYHKRQKTRNKTIKELVKNNFDSTNSVYVTLTFGDTKFDNTDLNACLRAFKNFMLKITRRYEDVRYISTFSKQTCGKWHFHLLWNVFGIKQRQLAPLWGHGFVKSTCLLTKNDVANVTNYLIKNMLENEDTLAGKKGYLYSKGLARNKVLRSWREDEADQCFQKFETLPNISNQRELYHVTHRAGVITELEYHDAEKKQVYIPNDEVSSDTTVISEVFTTVKANVVYSVDSEYSFLRAKAILSPSSISS